mmetsp:Transcript_74093/g.131003  ORF Transcript_74093/g.131003 Transcript_74093/m.131003 type:complete len:351 (-) Transcript_74093:126-1178(-)
MAAEAEEKGEVQKETEPLEDGPPLAEEEMAILLSRMKDCDLATDKCSLAAAVIEGRTLRCEQAAHLLETVKIGLMQRSLAFEVLHGRLSDAQTELDKALTPLPELIQEDVWKVLGQSSGLKRLPKKAASRSPPRGRPALDLKVSAVKDSSAGELSACTKRLRQHVKNYAGLPPELVEDLAGLFKALGLSPLEVATPLGAGGGTGETADTGDDSMAAQYKVPVTAVVSNSLSNPSSGRSLPLVAAAKKPAPAAPVAYPVTTSRNPILSGSLPPPPGTEPNSPVPTPPEYASPNSLFGSLPKPPLPNQQPDGLANFQVPSNVLAALASVNSLPGQVQVLDEDNRSHVSDESC